MPPRVPALHTDHVMGEGRSTTEVAVVSFELVVVAAEPGADEAVVRMLLAQCLDPGGHVEGDLDGRIVTFYEKLRAAYPDYPPYDTDAPWAAMPLATGVDHVFMNVRWSAGNEVIELVERLADEAGLALYDPQGDKVYLPTG